MDIVTIFFAYVLFFLFVHWISDFVLQNEKMSLNKSTSNYWLGIHVTVYSLTTITLWAGLFWVTGLHQFVKISQYVEAYLAIFVMHFITDYITSRITGKYYKAKKIHEFFVTIGFDQWLHYVQIFAVFNYIIL
jgi:hypothetical protein